MMKILTFILIFISLPLFGQKAIGNGLEAVFRKTFESINKDYNTFKDSVVYSVPALDYMSLEIPKVVLEPLVFKSEKEHRHFLRLKKRIQIVWPYLNEVVYNYEHIEDSLNLIEKKKDRRKYLKMKKNQLADEFEGKLKKLSRQNGAVLLKLIHRSTDKTAYDIIKELRGGISALLWNTGGGAYDLDLKSEFNPKEVRDDYYIEHAIYQLIAEKKIDYI